MSERASGRASGPVLTSRFLAVLNHSGVVVVIEKHEIIAEASLTENMSCKQKREWDESVGNVCSFARSLVRLFARSLVRSFARSFARTASVRFHVSYSGCSKP